MPRHKKSRKVGKIGITKKEAPITSKINNKHKTNKGNKPGSRQVDTPFAAKVTVSRSKTDPRIGSKRKIDLSKYDEKGSVAQKPLSPLDELNAIENDEKLEYLLEKQENNQLTSIEKKYVNDRLMRHRDLCELLGISEETDDEYDPFAALDAIKLEDFKDK